MTHKKSRTSIIMQASCQLGIILIYKATKRRNIFRAMENGFCNVFSLNRCLFFSKSTPYRLLVRGSRVRIASKSAFFKLIST